MARITRINTNVARQVLHSMVARADDKPFHSKGVTKNTFEKEILRKAEGKHLSIFRGTRNSVTRNEMKHSVKELTEFLKAHPKFSPNRRALETMGIHAYEGNALRENFNSEDSLKKVDRYAVGEQKDLDSSKKPVKSELELLQERRVAKARLGMNLYNRQKEQAEIASGKRTDNKTSITTGKNAANTITSHEGAGTIAGASRTAGKDVAPTTPIPGQPVTPSTPTPVHLAGGIGLSRFDGRPADRTDGIAMPTIVGASDARGSAPSTASSDEEPSTEKTVPTPGLKTEVTDIRPVQDADEELPSTEDIDKNLPLAA
ncbi:MAG: hypothetical protein Q8O51_00545 [bacterium]|nr:hypothetical protein [bacterium]